MIPVSAGDEYQSNNMSSRKEQRGDDRPYYVVCDFLCAESRDEKELLKEEK